VPRSLTYDCRSCRARHIAGNVWQHSGLPGGVQVESRGKDATLGPIEGWPGVPTGNDGIQDLVRLYLRMLGPATPVEVAKYFGSSAAEIKKVWPDDLVEVRVERRKAWLPSGSLDDLRSAEAMRGVRLLPAMDALLQARDRDILVPERSRQKEIWRPLGNPGVVLVDGEITGVWRAKMSGRKRVDLTVTPFEEMSAKVRKAVDEEAGQVARARGADDATVAYA
jgi:winged helix DNA-binding protein